MDLGEDTNIQLLAYEKSETQRPRLMNLRSFHTDPGTREGVLNISRIII